MLSEEEKKAIEELKQLKKDFEIVDKIVKDRDKQETKTIDAILNLIEKQQTEIKTLKKEKAYENEQYINIVNSDKGKLKDELEKANKIIDKMAEYIKEPYQLYLIKGRKTKMQAIIDYFRDKVEGETNENRK